VKFSEGMDQTASALAGAHANFTVLAGGYEIAVTGVAAGASADELVLSLSRVVTTGLGVKVRYTDPAGDTTTAVVQDLAGNDLVSSGSVGWSVDKSAVTANQASVAAGAIAGVFEGGLFGGTGADSFVYRGTGQEFLAGGAGSDTVTVSSTGTAETWYLAGYAASSSAALPSGVRAETGAGQMVYGFTSIAQPTNTVYAQAETITVGTSSFSAAGGVLTINGAVGQTVKIDPEVLGLNSSLRIGSGGGADTIIDATDFYQRYDTVVYDRDNAITGGVMESVAALIKGIEGVIALPTAAGQEGTVAVTVGMAGNATAEQLSTDTLTGIERLRFVTDTDNITSDVVMIGSAAGVRGYQSLAAAVSDPSGGNTAAVVALLDSSWLSMNRNSVIAKLDGMLSTESGNLRITMDESNNALFTGVSKVIVGSSEGFVTVHVVGSGIYKAFQAGSTTVLDPIASIDRAMLDAKPGDVIYIGNNVITTTTDVTSYTVYKENMVFMANSTAGNDKLELVLGDLENPAAPGSMQIKNLTLLGTADITVVGNGYDNVIIGNRGENVIYGLDGNDIITTGGGVDSVYGGTGNDLLVSQKGGSGATLLSGGSGDDLLVAATTDGSELIMTGGMGADTFKVAALSKNLNLKATIADLSARQGDDLDFTQLIDNGGARVDANDLWVGSPKIANYSGGDLIFSLGTSNIDLGIKSTTTSGGPVNVDGTLKVSMTTQSNVQNAQVFQSEYWLPGSTTDVQPLAGGRTVNQTVSQDLFQGLATGVGSASDELTKLMPLFQQ